MNETMKTAFYASHDINFNELYVVNRREKTNDFSTKDVAIENFGESSKYYSINYIYKWKLTTALPLLV